MAVCTAYSPNYAPLAALTVPTHRAWCEKHGYDYFHVDNLDPKRGDRIKIDLYRQIYAQGQHDTFVWIDTDAAISNTDVQIEKFVEWHDIEGKAHFIWGSDPAGPNSGFFVARMSYEAHMFLSKSLDRSAEMGWA